MIETEPYDFKQYKHFTEDLMTIIDFCHEVAHGKGSLAIMDAHDIAHVLLGGDRTRKWEWAKDWTSQPKPRDVTEAWPDVRLRMKELMERLEKNDDR